MAGDFSDFSNPNCTHCTPIGPRELTQPMGAQTDEKSQDSYQAVVSCGVKSALDFFSFFNLRLAYGHSDEENSHHGGAVVSNSNPRARDSGTLKIPPRVLEGSFGSAISEASGRAGGENDEKGP